MVIEFKETEFKRVQTLYKLLNYHLGIGAIIDGVIPGRIWVDNVENPRTALIWDKRYSYYFLGDENTDNFNLALDRLFTEEIAPDTLNRGIKQFFLICPENWEKKILQKEMLKDQSPMRRIKRAYYAFKQPQIVDWKAMVPPGYSIERINEKLLENTNLENIYALIGEIEDIIGSIEEFLRREFIGFCLVHETKELVSWCIAFFHASSCEITIQTVEKYQRRGFGTLTTAAFVEYCLSKNISMGWHTNQDNIGSIKLAEKIGFERSNHDYSWVFGWFNK
ncbi:MAG: GNAT family N-acetyltransferase [Candidatus Hermodarchaeota archaeon]